VTSDINGLFISSIGRHRLDGRVDGLKKQSVNNEVKNRPSDKYRNDSHDYPSCHDVFSLLFRFNAHITGARLYRRPVDVVVGIPSSVFGLG
jgi:hypothetical protein